MDGFIARLRRMPTIVIWLLGAIPLAILILDLLGGRLGVDPIRDIEHRLGRTAVYFLIGSLAFTPVMRLGRINLIRFRRPVGLLAFTYAVLHVATWIVLDMGLLWGQMLRDVAKRPYLTLGMAAFIILLTMALTSSNAVIRRMGPVRWRRLHRLVYVAAPLVSLHWLLSHKIWPELGIFWGLVILSLLGIRLVQGRNLGADLASRFNRLIRAGRRV
ncbi:sulfite oxidase heme-binding subunit YedZ [uncultured Paracoccus sp.]|uniref:sulfite oxidase heme-binding subunit YedZ n=1 Tax=uncultured Paracoccus sp. TaxID=189685 RepID=UPI00261A64E8|nr:protein-methionine-sulfoxide reductase heme-binding subunit MsrQ [uncultured Paracoccus sp.]